MKTKANVFLSLSLTGLMGFTMQMRQHPQAFRQIASTKDEVKKDEKKELKDEKKPTAKEQLAQVKKDIADKTARQNELNKLVADYDKQDKEANNPNECKEERAKTKLELDQIAIDLIALAKKQSELEPQALAEADKELEDIKKELADAKKGEEDRKKKDEEELAAKEKDSVACHKNNQMPVVTQLFTQLIQQQQMISSMFMQTQMLIFTQMLQNQYSLINHNSYENVGQRGGNLESILGMTQNFYVMPTAALPLPQVANNQVVPENNDTNTSLTQNLENVTQQSYASVSDVSRNPMYVPLFNGFTDGSSGLPQGSAIPFKF
ncbi:MAG: hypothetical protein ACOYL6_07040 [Bacteriovoracaceae bacterium]